MNTLKYKGYEGSVEYSEEDACLVGRVLHTNKANIAYSGESITEIKAMFEQAVDEYLQLCEEKGWQPEKTYKGSLNVRLGADLHKQAAKIALQNHQSLNDFIVRAVKQATRQQAV